jgi:tripartite-type tricarboxylate transporter receptor subunit TctC
MPELRIALAAAAISATLLVTPAAAQSVNAANYPSNIIKVIVCVPAGGGVDVVTRLVADHLRQRLGQPVIVENRAGQSGNLGAEAVYSADPDGYTLLASQPSPLTVNGLIYKKINYEPSALLPVAIMTRIPNTLTVRNDFPAKTAEEFVAYAKSHPGQLNYSSQGMATTSHLTAELFQAKTGTKLQHVPYKGTAPAINDLIAGHVDLMFTELGSAIELHRAGKARVLAVTSRERAAQLPDIPTLAEVGFPGVESDTWNAISAPPNTPPAIIAKLNAAINEILASREVRNVLDHLNVQPQRMTPAQAADFIKADTRRWTDVIMSAQIAVN